MAEEFFKKCFGFGKEKNSVLSQGLSCQKLNISGLKSCCTKFEKTVEKESRGLLRRDQYRDTT